MDAECTPPPSADAAVGVRPMRRDDLPDLVRWRVAPHVVEWFPAPVVSVREAESLYGDRLAGNSPVRMWVAQWGGRSIGYLQDFLVSTDDDLAVRCQDPTAVAFDYLIGEPDLIGQGLGSQMIDVFCRQVLAPDYPDAPRFLAAPEVRNVRSIRALERCGFTQGLWIQPEGTDRPQVVCTAKREQFVEAE